jgi:hypothetical protein
LSNPQTLNLYAMVSDNPETFADLDGHFWRPGDWFSALLVAADAPQQASPHSTTSNNSNAPSTSAAVPNGNGLNTPTITVSQARTTVTTDSSGNTTVTVTITSMSFSNRAGEEGEYLGSTTSTKSWTTDSSGDTTNVHSSSQAIDRTTATKIIGSTNVARAQGVASQANFARHFGQQVQRDAQAHPGKYVAAGLGVASAGTAAAGWDLASWALGVGAGGASLYDEIKDVKPY